MSAISDRRAADDAGEANRALGIEAADIRPIKRVRKCQRMLAAVGGVTVSVASFLATFFVVRESWWTEEGPSAYPYFAAVLAARPPLRSTSLMMLLLGTLFATLGAVAAVMSGGQEPLGSTDYGVWAREDWTRPS